MCPNFDHANNTINGLMRNDFAAQNYLSLQYTEFLVMVVVVGGGGGGYAIGSSCSLQRNRKKSRYRRVKDYDSFRAYLSSIYSQMTL